MNGTSGFQEVRSSTSRSPSYRYRYLHEQRHRFGTGAWHLFQTQAALNFMLTNRGWNMRRFSEYFFVSGLMLGSLLLQYGPASALDSTMAHHDKGSGTSSPSGCASDMTDPTQLG